MLNLNIVEDAYQVASRVEERLLKNRTRRIKGEVQQEEKGLQTKEVSFRLPKMRHKFIVDIHPKEEDS